MKTNNVLQSFWSRPQPGEPTPGKNGNGSRRFRSWAGRCALALCFIFAAIRAEADTNYIAHEWGTFTSVQGGNGKLLMWRPLQTAELPGFVYNLKNAGMNRRSLAGFNFKGEIITLQRLETPVIYFYANGPMNVDVDVKFPRGTITEWYPQAHQIGPTFAANTNASQEGILHESRAIWRNLEIVPPSKYHSWLSDRLPEDSSGSHYFAARATDANIVRANFTSDDKTMSEFEKFIFYRGVGNFKTPLNATVDSQNILSVENTGADELNHLFLIAVRTDESTGERSGAIAALDHLAPSNTVQWQSLNLSATNSLNYLPLEQFQNDISSRMEVALISQGLFPAEAHAMVNTWRDSWFTEEGVRVLYLLPRAWTDETLPLALNPQPKGLTRVMVGRAEIISPETETNLFQLLTQARDGDSAARTKAAAELKALGRFALPAMELANAHAGQTNIFNIGYQLLRPDQPSNFE